MRKNTDESLRRLLASAQFQPGLSHRELAKLSGLKETTVAYFLGRFESEGIGWCRPIIDLSRLGLIEIAVFLNLACPPGISSDAIMTKLGTHPSVGWITAFNGDFRFHFQLYGRTVQECFSVIDNLTIPKGVRIIQKEVGVRMRSAVCSKGYLSPGYKREVVWQWRGEPKEAGLTSLDWRLLRELDRVHFSSLRQAARALGESQSTVQRHFNSLSERNILIGFMLEIDPHRFDMHSYRLLLSFLEFNAALQTKIEQFLASRSEVDHFSRVFGNWDYEISIEVKDGQAAAEFCEQLSHGFSAEIRNLRVLEFSRHIKHGFCDFETFSN